MIARAGPGNASQGVIGLKRSSKILQRHRTSKNSATKHGDHRKIMLKSASPAR